MTRLKVATIMMAAALGMLPANAHASNKVIKGAFVGCLSKGSLDEFVTAAGRKDHRHMNALLGKLCVLIEGREYSIVSAGFITSTIRVYAGGGSVVLHTVSEALRR